MTSRTITLEDAQEHLPELVEMALQGDEIVIEVPGRPRVRLVPMDQPPTQPRVAGLNRGEIWISDDFDAPLPDEFWLGEP